MDKEKELWGHRFRIVKNGLDEADVCSFVDSLREPKGDLGNRLEQLDSLLSNLSEQYDKVASSLEALQSLPDRANGGDLVGDAGDSGHVGGMIDSLAQKLDDLAPKMESLNTLTNLAESNGIAFDRDKLEHLDSLTKLAERTIVEAEKEAERIRSEIEEQAHSNASNIIAEAEEKAKVEAERIIAEAREEAQNVLRRAQEKAENEALLMKQEADELMARSRQLVEGEVKSMFDQAYEKLLSNFRGTADAISIPADDQRVTHEPPESEDLSLHGGEATAPEDHDDSSFGQEGANHDQPEDLSGEPDEQPSLSHEEDGRPESEDTSDGQPDDTAGEAEQQPSPDEEERDEQESGEASEEHGKPTADLDVEQPPSGQDDGNHQEQAGLYEGTVELAIPPPVGLDQVMQLHKDLKNNPQLEVLNFGGSVDRGITIRLISHAPTPLIDIIGGMPGVESALDESQVPEQLVPARPPGDGPPIPRIIVTIQR